MSKKLSLFLILISVGLLSALAAGPVFGGNSPGSEGSRGFRALSGGPAANFVVPTDMELVKSFPLPAYGLTYERYQQFFGKARAEVLGGQITLYKDDSGSPVAVIGNHYPDISPSNSKRRSKDNARDDVARDIGPNGQAANGQKRTLATKENPAGAGFLVIGYWVNSPGKQHIQLNNFAGIVQPRGEALFVANNESLNCSGP